MQGRRSWLTLRTGSSSTWRRPQRTGVRIVRVLETHTHADHVSGHGRLALEHGVPVTIHPAADAGTRTTDARRNGVRARRHSSSLYPHARSPARALLPRGRDRTRGDVRGSSSPATRSSSEMPHGPTSRSRRARAPRGSSTRCDGSSSSETASRLSRTRRRLALREGDELGGVIDDRLRAALQRRWRTTTSPSSSPSPPVPRHRGRRTWSASSR